MIWKLTKMSKDQKEKKGSHQTSSVFPVCHGWILQDTAHGIPTGRPNLFPIITFGKYVEEDGRRKLSAALTISHASADGYHASMFFERLQEVLNEFVIHF